MSNSTHRGYTLSSIWAQDRNGVLGTGTSMLWHVPADFAHFKTMTMGHPIIMGRASFEALGRKSLPRRTNIVMTTSHCYDAPGALVVGSLEEALSVAGEHLRDHAEYAVCSSESKCFTPLVWITGGAQVYQQAMSLVDELVVTDLDIDTQCETPASAPVVFAPTISADEWRADPDRSDTEWRDVSGDARWKITTFVRRTPSLGD